MKRILISTIILLCSLSMMAERGCETYLYAEKDTNALYLDIHRPTAGVAREIEGIAKPTILYVFGGGFVSGARNDAYVLPWFKRLTEHGYTVVSIDYRLGMKGYKMGKGLVGLSKSVDQFYASQQMGVEDVFSAISYLKAHPELGIETDNIVISGSSAGAIISLASAYAVANGLEVGAPEGFRFKGVMSFAGALISTKGAPKFQSEPCPILFFHGMDDRAVAYRYFGAFGRGMWGSSYYAKKWKKKDYVYSIYRFRDRAHDVAAYMNHLWQEEQLFLEETVMRGERCVIDATVDNPALPLWKEWGKMTPQTMYNGK